MGSKVYIEFLRHEDPKIWRISLHWKVGNGYSRLYGDIETPSRIGTAWQENVLIVDFINAKTSIRIAKYLPFKELQDVIAKQGGSLQITCHGPRAYMYILDLPDGEYI